MRKFQVDGEVLGGAKTKTKNKNRFDGPYRIHDQVHEKRYRLRDNARRVIEKISKTLRSFLKGDVSIK